MRSATRTFPEVTPLPPTASPFHGPCAADGLREPGGRSAYIHRSLAGRATILAAGTRRLWASVLPGAACVAGHRRVVIAGASWRVVSLSTLCAARLGCARLTVRAAGPPTDPSEAGQLQVPPAPEDRRAVRGRAPVSVLGRSPGVEVVHRTPRPKDHPCRPGPGPPRAPLPSQSPRVQIASRSTARRAATPARPIPHH